MLVNQPHQTNHFGNSLVRSTTLIENFLFCFISLGTNNDDSVHVDMIDLKDG